MFQENKGSSRTNDKIKNKKTTMTNQHQPPLPAYTSETPSQASSFQSFFPVIRE